MLQGAEGARPGGDRFARRLSGCGLGFYCVLDG
jgi:hypothetical protein